MPPPLLNLRTALWCCAGYLSQSARASRPLTHVRPSPGCGPAPGYAASRSSISTLCAAFFRLAGLAHGRLIALKAGILIEDGVGGIAERLLIGNLLVVRLAGIGLTQIPHPLGLGMHDHHVLVAVRLVFATIVHGLFFRVLRALTATVRAIDDQFARLVFAALLLSKLAGLTFRHHLQHLQGLLKQRQQ